MQGEAVCTYCREPADTEDHLIPVSRQATRRRRGKMASVSYRVPCCALCNSLLGNCPAFTVRDRAAVLLLRYAQRPRSEARETWLKVRHLFTIVAGFELEAEIEEIDARQQAHIQAVAEAERQRVRQAFEDEQREEEAERARIAEEEEAERRAEEEARIKRLNRPKIKRGNWPLHYHVLPGDRYIYRSIRRYQAGNRLRLSNCIDRKSPFMVLQRAGYMARCDRENARKAARLRAKNARSRK